MCAQADSGGEHLVPELPRWIPLLELPPEQTAMLRASARRLNPSEVRSQVRVWRWLGIPSYGPPNLLSIEQLVKPCR